MSTPLPREPSGGTTLHQTIKQLIRCVRERTILGSTDYGLERQSDGVFLRFKQEAGGGGGSATAFRGVWTTDQQYKEGDIVYVRGAPIEGAGPNSAGTFFCVRDHTSTSLNYPTELLPEQQDPVSGQASDLWRTFAAGAWETLTVKAFPIQVVGPDGPLPPIDLPSFSQMTAGSVGAFSPGGFCGINGSGAAIAQGGSASGTWEAKCEDLPPTELAKFRLMNWCEEDKKYTAYFLCTAKKEVPGQ